MADNPNSLLFLGLPKRILTFLGVWILPRRNFLDKTVTAVVAAIQLSFLIFNLMYMVIVWGDVDEMSEGSYLLFTHVALCCKFINFVTRKDTFQQLLQAMDAGVFASQSRKHDEIFSKHSNRVRVIYKMLVVAALMNCTEWAVVPLLDKTQRLYPFHVWMPGDIQMSPNYELGYAYQILMAITSSQIFLALDAVFIGVIMFACAQFEKIMADMDMVQEVPIAGVTETDKRAILKRNNQLLTDCIKHHQAIIRFIDQVKNMFNIPVFIQMSGTIMIVCIVGFHISVEPPNTVHFYSTLNYLIVMLIQLYLYCWCGNELTIRNEQLRDSLYACKWYEQDKHFRKTLFFGMECTRRPLLLVAGQFITLLRPTFVSILRCSYSYFAILSQSQGKAK